MNEPDKQWMQVYGGKSYDIPGEIPSNFTIEDVAHALSSMSVMGPCDREWGIHPRLNYPKSIEQILIRSGQKARDSFLLCAAELGIK